MMAQTVIIFGRTRSTAPLMIAACRSSCVNYRPSARRRAQANQTSAGPRGLNCVQVAQLIAFATQSLWLQSDGRT